MLCKWFGNHPILRSDSSDASLLLIRLFPMRLCLLARLEGLNPRRLALTIVVNQTRKARLSQFGLS